MRVSKLLRQPGYAIYRVECRHKERSSWIAETSRDAELIYPLDGGFLLKHEAGSCVCLPARLTVIPAGARYQIGHFDRLADRTLVIRLRSRTAGPSVVSHLFLKPFEAAGLQLLAAALGTGADNRVSAAVPKLLRDIRRRIEARGIPHSSIVRAGGLERAIALLLRYGASATAEECAAAAEISEFRFRHLFRDCYATTPHAVRRTLRTAQSLRIILEGGTATSAARLSGFTHVSHLSSEFRRLTGRSPSALLAAFHVNGAREAAAVWHGV